MNPSGVLRTLYASGALLCLAGCVGDAPIAPPAELARRGAGLKATPGRLSFTALGAADTLTASTPTA